MSIKAKAKELVNKGKEFVVDHGDEIIGGVAVGLSAVGLFMFGEKYAINMAQFGWDRLEAAKVIGVGTIKNGQFVQITQGEACELIRAYNATLK